MMNFDAILFDMDGLLVDSEPVWHEVEVELIESHGYRYADEVRDMGVGMRVDEFAAILQAHYPKLGDSPAAIERAITERMLRLPAERVQSRPGAEAIIRYAVEKDIPRAIASSSSQVIIEHFVRLLGWGDWLPQRYSAEFVPRGKPAPDIYLHAATQLGVLPQRCLALEDSRAGTIAAIAAGMTCFTVPDLSHSTLADFAQINPHVFPSLDEAMAEVINKRLFA
ncbi:MAG: HAD family phosphatase [Chloroflexi bacterium]|nr:HAD family phosphatase [Chloroflexota bacterium]MCY3582214.1 HAD family phosphatase [Chloroflexota bacterium]MCY3715046.1 HAD family phosphatase [Chloroflexota bacterium]MDE2650572.1 HAD family phosphatase [Chloroflexota bacterium]MXV93669.1 HAD family phosphatase [Chloroflexota bacterium]